MIKSEIRKLYLEKRKSLSQDEILNLSSLIYGTFFSWFQPLENQKIHLFLSIEKFNEINTNIFIEELFENKSRVFVPKVLNDKLISVEINKNTLFKENYWGITEPLSNENYEDNDFDFVIVPLLYSDNQGNRVGYGKGFYDKFFSGLNSKTKKIGINYFIPNEKIDDISEFDIPLDYLVTPTEVLSF